MANSYYQFKITEKGIEVPKENLLVTAFFECLYFLLSKVIPKANPDFEKSIDNVIWWMIEFDNNGLPIREIGLDIDKNVIFRIPFKENIGYWLDNDLKLEDFKKSFDLYEIPEYLFRKYWLEFSE